MSEAVDDSNYEVEYFDDFLILNLILGYIILLLLVNAPYYFILSYIGYFSINKMYILLLIFTPLIFTRVVYSSKNFIKGAVNKLFKRLGEIEEQYILFLLFKVFTLSYLSILFWKIFMLNNFNNFIYLSIFFIYTVIFYDIYEYVKKLGKAENVFLKIILSLNPFLVIIVYLITEYTLISNYPIIKNIELYFPALIGVFALSLFLRIYRFIRDGNENDLNAVYQRVLFVFSYILVPFSLVYRIMISNLTLYDLLIAMVNLTLFSISLFNSALVAYKIREDDVVNYVGILQVYIFSLLNVWTVTGGFEFYMFIILLMYYFIAYFTLISPYKHGISYILMLGIAYFTSLEYISNPGFFSATLTSYNAFLNLLSKVATVVISIVLVLVNSKLNDIKRGQKQIDKLIEKLEEDLQPRLKTYIFNLESRDRMVIDKLKGTYIKEKLRTSSNYYIKDILLIALLVLLIVNFQSLILMIWPDAGIISLVYEPKFTTIIFFIVVIALILTLKTGEKRRVVE